MAIFSAANYHIVKTGVIFNQIRSIKRPSWEARFRKAGSYRLQNRYGQHYVSNTISSHHQQFFLSYYLKLFGFFSHVVRLYLCSFFLFIQVSVAHNAGLIWIDSLVGVFLKDFFD